MKGDILARRRLADVHVGLGVLAIVLVETVGPEGAEDPIADDMTDLILGHPSVQAEGSDQVYVLHAGLRRHVDDFLHHQLAHIGRGHRRQW